jgi:hypothetical protein
VLKQILAGCLGITFSNVIFQHPVALCISGLGVSAPCMCNVFRCSFVRHYFTTCFGLNGHLQVYSLLYFRTLLLTVMRFSLVAIAACCFGYVGCTWLFLLLFGLLVVAALSVLAAAGVLLCAGRPS